MRLRAPAPAATTRPSPPPTRSSTRRRTDGGPPLSPCRKNRFLDSHGTPWAIRALTNAASGLRPSQKGVTSRSGIIKPAGLLMCRRHGGSDGRLVERKARRRGQLHPRHDLVLFAVAVRPFRRRAMADGFDHW